MAFITNRTVKIEKTTIPSETEMELLEKVVKQMSAEENNIIRSVVYILFFGYLRKCCQLQLFSFNILLQPSVNNCF